MTESTSSIEIEVGIVRFKVTGNEAFVKAEFQRFMDDLLEDLTDIGSRSTRRSRITDLPSSTTEVPKDIPEWARRISSDSGIEIGYIKSFFREHKGLLRPPQWQRKGVDKEDGPDLAHVLLYVNKIGLNIEKISGVKITGIFRSLGIGDLAHQSNHLKEAPGIVGGGGWYELNPTGAKRAIHLLREQLPK